MEQKLQQLIDMMWEDPYNLDLFFEHSRIKRLLTINKTEMIEINDNAKNLMAISAKELSEELEKNPDALQVKMKACDHLLDGNEEVQIQVVVTRDRSDFLDYFQMEVVNSYNS